MPDRPLPASRFYIGMCKVSKPPHLLLIYVRERQAAIADAYSFVSHSLRNKLGRIGIAANRLAKTVGSDNQSICKIKDTLSSARTDITGIAYVIKLPEYEVCDITQIWQQTITNLQDLAEGTALNILKTPVGNNITINRDAKIIKSIFYNLVLNAIEHILLTSDKQTSTSEIWLEIKKKEHELKLYICNTGSRIGCDPNSIFNMGVSTKSDGSGFGLYFSRLRAKDLRGDLQLVSNKKHQGADVVFKLTLPVSGEDK